MPVIVAAGWDESATAKAALSPFLAGLEGDGSGALALAWGDARLAKAHKALSELIAHALGATYTAITSVAPAPIPLTGWVRTARSRHHWAAVDVDDRSDRLRTAWMRRELVDAAAIIAINRIPAAESSDPLIIGLWARFAHPRQRLGALASDDRTGLRAELATAVKPALCVLIGESRDRPLIVATEDQIAAELTGRSLQFLSHHDPFGEQIGPWELPLVQRATELDLGIRLPEDLSFEAAWAGEPGGPGEQMLQATVEQLRLKVSVLAH